jgi:hypothetical protein
MREPPGMRDDGRREKWTDEREREREKERGFSSFSMDAVQHSSGLQNAGEDCKVDVSFLGLGVPQNWFGRGWIEKGWRMGWLICMYLAWICVDGWMYGCTFGGLEVYEY